MSAKKCVSNTLKTEFLKQTFIILSLLSAAVCVQARNYYFSSSTGNDSYSTTQAQNQATPWRSVSKLNAVFSTLVGGDAVYFKRGDVFYGGIVVNKSGSNDNPIIISSYGSGERPVISGFTTLSGWASNGNGIYQATASGISNQLNMVTFNNQPQIIGRSPNADATNGGYLNYESYSGNTSITDNQLTGTPNWTGAELVLRKAKHVIEHSTISSHSGNAINFIAGTGYYRMEAAGYGYFFQKDIRCLDQLGEWYYNTGTRYLQMYFGSSNPSSYSVKVSTVDILLNISRYSFVTVSELQFEGANLHAINIGSTTTNTSNVTVRNCDIDFSGTDGIYATNTDYPRFEYCNINNSYNMAIEVENEGGISTFTNINHNTLRNSGVKAGMGSGFGDSYQGVSVMSTDAVIEYNNIDSTGYIGIAFYYSNAKVRNNFITNFSFIKDDGGGIYTWTGPVGGPVYSGREVKNNIILNAIGAGFGTPNGLKTAHGIYMDDGVVGVDISGNSVAFASVDGIYIHNAHEINVADNTVYNSELQQILFVHDNITPTDPIRNLTFKNNIMVAKRPSQLCFNIRSIKDDISQMGTFDDNYYARPADDDMVISAITSATNASYSLDRWKANFGKDGKSKKSPKEILPYRINGLTSGNLVNSGDFLTGLSGISAWSQNNNHLLTWDGSSKLAGSGSLRISFPVSTPNLYTILTKAVGALSSSKNYILRLTTLGTTPNGILRVYLRNGSAPLNTLVPSQYSSFNASTKTHEFLFTAPASVSAANLVLEVQQNSGTTYIDNIQLFEANVSTVDMDDQIRFEYNATSAAKTISLDAKYIGVDGTAYNGTITLQPYTSKIIFRDGIVTATGLAAVATAPNINCFGGTTAVTVNASGGRAPYTGTGSFSVNAGKGSIRIGANSPVSGEYTSLYSSIGAISSSKNYVLRFSTLGTTASGNLRASLRQTNSPWASITSAQSRTFGTSRVDHEFTFSAPSTQADASFYIEVLQSSGITYIDNIAVFEATSAGVLTSNNLFSTGQLESNISALDTWSADNNHTAVWDTTSKISNTYYYPVRDASGSTVTATARVLQPVAALRATSTAGTVTFTGGTTTVVVAATGGTAPYAGIGSFSNVRVGRYNYTVTDAAGCTSVTTVNVTQSSQTTFTAAAIVQDINCFGGNTTVNVSGAGGVAPYTGTGDYGVNAGRGSLRIAVLNPEQDAHTLIYGSIGAISSAKSYVLRFSTLGTSGNGSLQATIRQTNSPWSIIGFEQSSTYGTSRVDHEFVFNAPSTSGDASFLISILQSSGVTYIDNIAFFESTSTGVPVSANLFDGDFENDLSNIEIWSPGNNHSATLDLTSKISNTYYYAVKDATGKIAIASAEVSQPTAALRASSTAGSITVTGGTTIVVVNATGGTAPYTGTGSFANVRAGTYSYTVTDAAGCVSVTSITINQSGSTSLVAAANAPNISCFGGNTSVTVTASGGRTPYAGTGVYTVNAGRGSARISVNNPVPFTYTYLYASIGPVSSSKNYILRFSTLGTDENGGVMAGLRRTDPAWGNLIAMQTASFGTARVNHEFLFTAPETTDNGSFLIKILQTSGITYVDNIAVFEAAADGDLVSEDLFGKGQFENNLGTMYTWSQTDNHTVTVDLTSKISNIYYYPVSDANGAVITVPAVTSQPGAALQAFSTAGNVTVTGGTTIVTVTATGGTAPYTGTGSFANVRVGSYNYTVTDARGCTSTTRIIVTQNVAARAITSTTQAVGTSIPTAARTLSDRALTDNALVENKELRINAYPNPSSNSFGLEVKGGSKEMVYISISTADGKVLYQTKGNTNSKYVFGNNFVPGIYILKATQGKISRISKIIKGTL